MRKVVNLLPIFILLFSVVILIASVRGIWGNPNASDLLQKKWREDGPLELSPERGRYALIYSIVEDKSFYFSTDLARFIIPDLGYKNGKYVSLFAPGVSFLAIPGYLIGKYFGISQVGAFLVSSLFALLNGVLIYLISLYFTKNRYASMLASILFMFATPSFAYAASLYQHHISTFLILSSIYLLTLKTSFWKMSLVWLLCAFSIPIDYPNLFLMFPIGLYSLSKYFIVRKTKSTANIRFRFSFILSFLTALIPLAFFFWFNKNSYGDPLQFSGTVKSVREIDANGNPSTPSKIDPTEVREFLQLETKPDDNKKSATNFFNTRDMVNGFYIHIFSPDRGVVYFTPVIFLGLIGIIIMFRKKLVLLPVLIGIVGINLVLYSMWGDPWGGWAFGSRYLIPLYAVMSIFVAMVLAAIRNKWYLLVPILLVLLFSISVNALGPITTSTNPPQVEALPLEKLSGKRERFSFDRNWEYLTKTGSKSFVYQTWANKYMVPVTYYFIIAGSIAVVATLLTFGLYLDKNEKN